MPEIVPGKRAARDDGDYQAESLRGKISLKDVGSRVVRERPTRDESLSAETSLPHFLPNTVLAQDNFEIVMSFVQSFLEDLPHEAIREAADSVVAVMKDESRTDIDKKREVEGILEPMSNEKFNELYNTCQKFFTHDETIKSKNEELSVAVIFDEDESANELDASDSEMPDQNDAEDGSVADPLASTAESVSLLSTAVLQPSDITPHWLENYLQPTGQPVKSVLEILALDDDLVENELLELLNFNYLDIVKTLAVNSKTVYWLTRLQHAQTGPEKASVEEEMRKRGFLHLLDSDATPMKVDDTPRLVDLDALTFPLTARMITSFKVKLPSGSTKTTTRLYVQYHVPYVTDNSEKKSVRLKLVSELPQWARCVFAGIDTFNPVQSRVFETAFNTDDNILLCAPTGSGKTNVALLTILRCLDLYRNKKGQVDPSTFKAVYISPLKALVQEQVRGFSERLEPLGVVVNELSGDRNLSRDQLEKTNIIVTTPEKWDVVTRKTSDISYVTAVRLVILDEIHLLHDPRGPALENIVARALRFQKETGASVRLVGLSATLPNYRDVASFLHVKSGLYYFDSSFRPCPLNQLYLGVTEKKPLKRYRAVNEACYDKVMEYIPTHQVIIFVHSRKETVKTAQFLYDRITEVGKSGMLNKLDDRSIVDVKVRELLLKGIGIHHAGINREDRSTVESLFAEQKIKILVSTATLAWGVNLPAHAVIVKGTQVYNPEIGGWEELSPQDVIQMLGRAGRPGYDSSGDGIIITGHENLNYYMSVMTAKLPIESQMMSRLAESINAEIALGSVLTLSQGVDWLGYTYLFVRMQRDPALYRVGADYDADPDLLKRRRDLVHSAFVYLEQCGLVEYDQNTGAVVATNLGRIAADFYIAPDSMSAYNKQLKPYLGAIDIFRVFSRSREFRRIPVRQEEKIELARLLNLVPIPVRESNTEGPAKINVLLQAYISRMKLEGIVLSADMVYIAQSASRIFRAMFEISLVKGWAQLAEELLNLFKMVDRRMWLANSPMRQFPSCSPEIIRKTEGSQMPWHRYFDLESAAEVGQAIRDERRAEEAFELLSKFPRVTMEAFQQPLTHTLLRVNVDITPVFVWDSKIHKSSELFLLMIEDGDGFALLYSDWVILRETDMNRSMSIQLTVEIRNDRSPYLFVKLMSDRWLHADYNTPVDLTSLIVPPKFAAPTAHPGKNCVPAPVGISVSKLNCLQEQVYAALFDTDSNCFVGMAAGTGKTICAELVIRRHLNENGLVVYLSSSLTALSQKMKKWETIFDRVGKLTGNWILDSLTLMSCKLILSTYTDFEVLMRRWRRRRALHNVRVVICDDIDTVGGLNGYVCETVILRVKIMAAHLDLPCRIVALGLPIADARELSAWLGIEKKYIFNFSPLDRPNDVHVDIKVFLPRDYKSRMLVMARPALQLVMNSHGRSLIVLPDRAQCLSTANDLLRLMNIQGVTLASAKQANISVKDKGLKWAIENGMPFLYTEMDHLDRIAALENTGSVLLVSYDAIDFAPRADTVVVMNTQVYDWKESKYLDYTAGVLSRIIGKARVRASIFTSRRQQSFYLRFLRDPLPVESHLNYYLADTLLPDIAESVVTNAEEALNWLAHSFFFHRVSVNPSYYGVKDQSENTMNEFLSEMIESSFDDLAAMSLINKEDDDILSVEPLVGAQIVAHCNLSAASVESLMNISPKARLKGILTTISQVSEFDRVLSNAQEIHWLSSVQGRMPFVIPDLTLMEQKPLILIQAYLSRLNVPPALREDLSSAVKTAIDVTAACIDCLSGEGKLNVLVAIELLQMLSQGLWNKDSPLKQIPHVDSDIVERCVQADVVSVHDFMAIEDDELRTRLLGFDESDPRMFSVAEFVNKYPSVDIQVTVEPSMDHDKEYVLYLAVEKEIDEEDDGLLAVTTQLNFERPEQWYIIVGSISSWELYAIKKVTIAEPNSKFKVLFTPPSTYQGDATVWFMCDSYLDADKEVKLELGK